MSKYYYSLTLIIISCVIIIIYTMLDKITLKSLQYGQIRKKSDMKMMVDWTGIWSSDFASYWKSHRSYCPELITKCNVTTDRNLYGQADAIIFHIREFNFRWGLTPMPAQRFAHQRYVLYIGESPMYTYYDLHKADNLFNWTLSHRRDSDIWWPYGQVIPSNSNFNLDTIKSVIRNKTKLVAWFVSNCDTDSKREVYVKKLQKYIQVDIYGKCGSLQCDANVENCDKMLNEQYKFYLAFENSVCDDYVTEKFYFRVIPYVIPIVLRDNDYTRTSPLGYPTAPPDSYIAADNFENPKQLADFLKFLASNESEYLKFFRWRKKWKVTKYYHNNTGLCKLCRMLHGDLARKTYSGYDIYTWWYGNKYKSVCHSNYALKFINKTYV